MTAVHARIDELRARVTEKGPWFVVPAETRPTLCSSCRAAVFFVQQPSGKLMPIDALVPGGLMPRRGTHTGGEIDLKPRDGRGVSHFATCPSAARHRRPR